MNTKYGQWHYDNTTPRGRKSVALIVIIGMNTNEH